MGSHVLCSIVYNSSDRDQPVSLMGWRLNGHRCFSEKRSPWPAVNRWTTGWEGREGAGGAGRARMLRKATRGRMS
jgi:hypothetical protein